MFTMYKDGNLSSHTVKNENEFQSRFVLLSTKIPSDALLAVSILIYFLVFFNCHLKINFKTLLINL